MLTFGFDGTNYEIDLTDDNADQLREAFSDYIAADLHTSNRSGRASSGSAPQAWQPRGARQDPRVSRSQRPRCLLPRPHSQAVRDAYDAAH
ncbi:Lsr2 dimerization domain-containing protein [Curtobacterium sp. PsM8]|uniref:Lsr2 dimerization domain-containing protein n=1 Tax=Curtobacterium sp. PsM8 TaxID=3030532 RepID=UPI00263BDB39|nr:histone-like nucleoid-structuring protein Lsr2 [Curtobacterium sp. PsM8]MDN4647756.1 Lsr2 family protein [Curtobacterium sp. PsM8]